LKDRSRQPPDRRPATRPPSQRADTDARSAANSDRPDRPDLPAGPPRPVARGPLSSAVLSALRRPPGYLGPTPPMPDVDALVDDDLQLALYCCYELHYRGLAGAHPDWEWDPGLIALRADMERAFLHRLRDEIAPAGLDHGGDVGGALVEMIAGASGPSLSTFLHDSGTLEQFREFCVHRSAYQLKEADPHTFAIPRLGGDAKAAMVEIQHDEYGCGRSADMHSTLFAATLTALDLDPRYGTYLDRLPAVTLATVNLISLFGLHRRWRGATVGHLAVFEMTSVEPMGRYSRALARMGVGPEGRRFFDVHVAADARHGVVALERMVAGLIEIEPQLGDDLLFGAAALLAVEERFARHLLAAWSAPRSSLLPIRTGHTGPVALDAEGCTAGFGPEPVPAAIRPDHEVLSASPDTSDDLASRGVAAISLFATGGVSL